MNPQPKRLIAFELEDRITSVSPDNIAAITEFKLPTPHVIIHYTGGADVVVNVAPKAVRRRLAPYVFFDAVRPTAAAITAAFVAAFGPRTDNYQGCWEFPNATMERDKPAMLLNVFHNCGLPEEFTAPGTETQWRHLEAELGDLFNFEVYIENQNGDLSYIWKL